jgi:hypothetical protein
MATRFVPTMRGDFTPVSMLTARLAVGCLLLLGACGHRPVSAPVAGRCVQIDRENREALATLARIQKTPIPELDSALRDALRCVETPHGAWALALGTSTVDDEGIRGEWSLVHIDAIGRRLSVAPNAFPSIERKAQNPDISYGSLEWSRYEHTVPAAPVLFDFDGDGVAEAVVVIRTDSMVITDHISRGRVWTAPRDAITLYRPARDIVVDEVRDVDEDGRPDLITHERYVGDASINCGSGEGYFVLGPPLLMHSLTDGTFSLDDATAVAFAKRKCPVLPRPVIAHPDPKFEEMVDIKESANNIVCARLRGADKGRLLSEIETQCYQLPEDEGGCLTCDSKELLQRWATIDPPLRIR